MRKATNKPDQRFFRLMIESVEPGQSFFQIFWGLARHPGEAIESVPEACVPP